MDLPRAPGAPGHVNFWMRRRPAPDEAWQPDPNLTDIPVTPCDGRAEGFWNRLNIQPTRPQFSVWRRDVVPSYAESDGKATASFALHDRLSQLPGGRPVTTWYLWHACRSPLRA
jgi:hypothetical protein